MHEFMNHLMTSGIAYDQPNEGASGGGAFSAGATASGELPAPTQEGASAAASTPAEEEITIDPNDPFASLYSEEDDEDEDAGGLSNEEVEAAQADRIKAMATEMEQQVAAYAVPENMIPEDFNVSDPKQLRALLTKTGQHAVANALRAMFPPLNAAMKQQHEEMQQYVLSQQQQGFQQDRTEAQLLQKIPMYGTRGGKVIIEPLFKQAMKRNKGNVDQAIQATVKSLQAAGINFSGVNDGTQQVSQTAAATGLQALEGFAPLPASPSRVDQNL